jgi:hypothetical protein
MGVGGGGSLLLAGVLTILAWPIVTFKARASLDESWQVGLHLAARLGLQHGVDVIFTYGPLGFLGFPLPFVGPTSALAFAAAVAIYLALIGTMLVEAIRILPLWAACVVTLLAARILAFLPPFEALEALFILLCIRALAGRLAGPIMAQAALLGILAGAAVLGKVNVGVFAGLMGVVTVTALGRTWWRPLAAFLAAAIVSGLVCWIASGQQLGNLAAYARGVVAIVAGYNDAMGTDLTDKRQWVVLVVVAAGAMLGWAAWRASLLWTRRSRIGLAALALVVGFAMWKTLVVREHAIFVMATAITTMFALGVRASRTTWLVGLLGLGIGFAGVSSITPAAYLDVVGSVRSVATEARDVVLPGRADRAVERTRTQLLASYRIEPDVLATLTNHSVHVDPALAAVVFAYPELRWAPLPIFQSYSAYTTDLDRINADVLRSTAAPERILRSFRVASHTDLLRSWIDRPFVDGEVIPSTVDGRFRWFESPDTTLETFCRYQQVAASDRWQALARTGRSCGPAEPLATVQARAGEIVTIPTETRPDRFVIVRIHGLEPSLLVRIRSALTKGPDWYVVLDGTRYRLIAGTALDGLLLAVPPAADGTGRFAFGPPIRQMTIKQGAGGKDSRAPLTFEFLSVPLAAP